MTQLADKYLSHQLHSRLETNSSLLSYIESSYKLDSTSLDQLARLKATNVYLRAALGSVDPTLASIPRMDALAGHVDRQNEQLQNYKNDQNEQYLINANEQVDNILSQLIYFLPPVRTGEGERISDALSSFHKLVSQYTQNVDDDLAHYKSRFDETVNRLKTLTEDINSQKTRLDAAIGQFQQQFSDAESKRLDQYAQAEKGRNDELLKIQQQSREAENLRKDQFNAEAKSREDQASKIMEDANSRFGNLVELHKINLDAAIEKAKLEFETIRSTLSSESGRCMSGLEQYLKEAQQLLFVIGNTGMAGGYQKLANTERVSARLWHATAVAFVIVLIIFAIYAYEATLGNTHWTIIAGRVFVTVCIGVGSAYAARQAARHEEIERKSRKTELEIASINPYLADLPKETQNEVKKLLAERLFGQVETVSVDSKQATGTSADIAKIIVDALKLGLEQMSKK